MMPPPEDYSDNQLVQSLLKRSEDNAAANKRLVDEKTVKAGLPGVYGPFANTVPIMRGDGSFDSVSFSRYDKLKDRGKLAKSSTGLDVYIPGFDPDAPEPEREKFLGIF